MIEEVGGGGVYTYNCAAENAHFCLYSALSEPHKTGGILNYYKVYVNICKTVAKNGELSPFFLYAQLFSLQKFLFYL